MSDSAGAGTAVANEQAAGAPLAGRTFVIRLTADESIAPQTFAGTIQGIPMDNPTNGIYQYITGTSSIPVNITIEGAADNTVTLSLDTTAKTGSLITSIALGTIPYINLTLDGKLTLEGSSSNAAPLISLYTGISLTIPSTGTEVSIEGNTYTTTNGSVVAGVLISGGTFTMDAGKITNNTMNMNGDSAAGAAGVYLLTGSSTFTMGGSASVTGNTGTGGASGGVFVNDGTFTMNSGASVTNNTGTASLTGAEGAWGAGGVFVIPVNGGIFNQNGCDVSGNTAKDKDDNAVPSHNDVYITAQ
jgi:hypothetical protein